MEEYTDEQLSALIYSHQINNPEIKCSGNNLICRICINQTCNGFALHCDLNKCKQCSEKHFICASIPFQGVTQILKAKCNAQCELLFRMFQIQNKLVQQLKQIRKNIIKNSFWGSFQKMSNWLEEIYFRKNYKIIKGTEGKQLFKCLTSLSKTQQLTKYLQDFEFEAKQIVSRLHILKDRIVQVYNKQIDSKILENKGFSKNVGFIYQSLSKPKRLELLYRASQHNFSAKAFHQKCNNIKDTLTIVKTEFGKIIAGFTPLEWNGNDGYADDSSMKSFLLQINLQQKMHLLSAENAIYRSQGYGPIFGKAHDLYISDKCDKSNKNGAIFPSSYNGNGYVNGQQSFTAFSGAPNDYQFKVQEYEVFRVIWD